MRNGIQVNLALEASIHIGLAILLAIACLLILRPFIPLLVWGTIIAVSAYPGFQKVRLALGGRGVWTAILFTVPLLVFLIVPMVLLAGTLVEGVQTLAAHFKEGALFIPPPPASVETWPIVGVPLKNVWALASRDLSEAVRNFAPQIKAVVPELLSASAAIGLAVLHQGRDFPDLVPPCCHHRQRSEAVVTGPRCWSSHRGGVSRCHWWIRCYGNNRIIRWSDRSISWL